MYRRPPLRAVARVTGDAAAGEVAFKRGYEQWSAGDRTGDDGLAHHALAALQDLRTATASLG